MCLGRCIEIFDLQQIEKLSVVYMYKCYIRSSSSTTFHNNPICDNGGGEMMENWFVVGDVGPINCVSLEG